MTVPVFLNDRCLTVEAGLSVGVVLGQADPAWADAIASGRVVISDGRGIALAPSTIVTAGMIVRALVSARRPEAGC